MDERCKKELETIFEECQTGNHTHLLRQIQKLRTKTKQTAAEEEFWTDFCHLLQHFLIVGNNETSVNKALEFTSVFVQPSEINDDELLLKLFDFLIPLHRASSISVRVRVCQLTKLLLTNMKDDYPINDELYTKVQETMLSLLKDKSTSVRQGAVKALSRLQNPSDENCTIIKEYIFHVECDPCAEVRAAVINHIGTSKKILQVILERTRDVKDSVRKAAFCFLAEKVHFRCLKIAQRVQLLKDGIQDRSEIVMKTVISKLIPAWIQLSGGTVLKFLSYLDVENFSEAAEIILSSFLKNKFNTNLIDECIQILEREQLLNISPETPILSGDLAFYWRVLVEQCLDDEMREKFLPELKSFCEFVEKIANSTPSDDIEKNLHNEFIMQQLILLVKGYEIIDDVTKQIIVQFSQRLLLSSVIMDTCINSLVDLLVATLGEDENKSIPLIVETISEIQLPTNVSEDQITSEQENDSSIWKRCLIIACKLLEQPFVRTLHPSIQSLMDNLLLPGIQNSDPLIRNLAVKGLGLACLLSKQQAQHNALLFLQILQLDQESVRITAAKTLFDLLLSFGVEAFQPDDNENDDGNNKMNIVSVLTLLLDNEESEVRSVVVEGLGKLLLSQIISSTKLISRLILLWFNPISDDQSSASHFLGVFLPVFASASRQHQQCIEEAFLPTLNTIFEAPKSSPIKDVNPDNVAKFMVALMHSRMIKRNKVQKTAQMDNENLTPVHYSLGLRVCNALLNEERNHYIRVYLKTLSWLDFNECEAVDLRHLSNLHAQIAELKLDKISAKLLIKFQQKLLDEIQEPEQPNCQDTHNS